MHRLLLLAALLVPTLMRAQSTAHLAGTVVDPSGAAVAQARVISRNIGTDLSTTATTNSHGLFRFPDLPVGAYEVTVMKEGFGTLVRTGIQLLTEQTVDLTMTLQIGQTSQSVQVSAPVLLVQNATSDLGLIVDSRQMSDLPLNGRNAFDLAALAPGATETISQTIPGQQDNIGLAVNGLSTVDNNWSLDGATYANRSYGSAPTLPNPDTLQEFTARTTNFDASSRGAGATVKLTTRSGTNQMHGTVFEFLRNDTMDARNFFDVRTEPYKQNQYGGTFGGPIRKDKLFFFGSFQGTNQRGAPSPNSFTVPDALTRVGDYSQSGRIIVDPTTLVPLAGDVIPKSRLDPIATSLEAFIPLPNSGKNGLYTSPSANRDDYQYLGKIDYLLNSKNHISGRYFYDKNTNQRNVNSLPGIYASNQYDNQTALVSDTVTLSPTWVMTASYNFLRTFRSETPVAPTTMQALGAQVPFASQNDGDKLDVTITGYTSLAISGGSTMHPATNEAVVDFSHVAGRHLIRFGSSFRRNTSNAFSQNDAEAGGWAFTAARTTSAAVKNSGDAFASFLLGVPTTFTQASSSPNNYLITTFDAFVQDDWKITRHLTLNLGLRYDPWLPPHDGKGYLAGFVPGRESTLAPLAPLGLVFGGDPNIPAAIEKNRWNTFSPRFGFAWDALGDGKTIVRGGYGIFRSGTEFFGLISTLAGSVPFRTVSVSIPNPVSTENPYASYGPAPFPYTPPSSLTNYKFPANIAIRVLDPNTKPGYTQSWNFTIERQIARDTAFTLSYVGNHSIDVMTRYQANPGIYGPGATTGNVNTRRLYPGFGNLTLAGSFGWSHYNALQAQLTKRTAHGLTMMVNYTFGKADSIDSSGAFATALGAGPRDPFNLRLDYGPADYDLTQSFNASMIYDLPKMHAGPSGLRHVLNGWQVNTITTARTGFPVTCRSGVDNSLTSTGNDTCDVVNPNTARPAGTNFMKEWFNTAAFATNKIGTFGSAGRNILRRPGLVNVNLSLFRHFQVTEKLAAEFRAEAFNTFNHPNFDLFFISNSYTNSEILTSPTFGQITSATDPRLMQLAIKLRF